MIIAHGDGSIQGPRLSVKAEERGVVVALLTAAPIKEKGCPGQSTLLSTGSSKGCYERIGFAQMPVGNTRRPRCLLSPGEPSAPTRTLPMLLQSSDGAAAFFQLGM